MMNKSGQRANIAILGAGIMGSCLALALARSGYQTDLIDIAPAPMMGASLHNEGKLHLGFVSAEDPTRTTHLKLIPGSLSFAQILSKLTGCSAIDLQPSQPFMYFIPRDSQVDFSQIKEYFFRVESDIQKEIERSGHRYLGQKIDKFYRVNSREVHQKFFSGEQTVGSFRTEEQAVSPSAVAGIITRAISEHENINYRGRAEVIDAAILPGDKIQITTRRNNQVSTTHYSCAVNCLWDGKYKIDHKVGFPDPGPWIYRYKATINLKVPALQEKLIPSATGILGPYGDIVNHGQGHFYLSWYPLCKMAQNVNADGRRLHSLVHKNSLSRLFHLALVGIPAISGPLSRIFHREFVTENISALSRYVPALKNLLGSYQNVEVGGGVILARGSSDIDDPDSYLHLRSEIGPVRYKNYLSIDTGKYCTAPLFAVQATELVKEILS